MSETDREGERSAMALPLPPIQYRLHQLTKSLNSVFNWPEFDVRERQEKEQTDESMQREPVRSGGRGGLNIMQWCVTKAN